MELQQPASQETPVLKLEHSPVESLMSIPASEVYSPLFSQGPSPDPSTASPAPETHSSGMRSFSQGPEDILAGLSIPLITPTPNPEPPAEKKPTKKRKSWGQVLPEPKTNLPPRKRAKTEDEKEQRRVERVLRNRKAAQSSRERKRQETEKLEQRCRELENTVVQLQKTSVHLVNLVKQLRSGETDCNPAVDALINSPTLGLSLFPEGQLGTTTISANELTFGNSSETVNPSRLSPPLSTVAEDHEHELTRQPSAATPIEATPEPQPEAPVDMTQHPAAVLCDLQCQSTLELPPVARETPLRMKQQLGLAWIAFVTSATLTAISVLQQTPIWIAYSVKQGLPLHPSRPVLTTIIWMLTRASSTWTNSSTVNPRSRGSLPPSNKLPSQLETPSLPKRSNPSPRSLKSKYLRKILTSSPSLARPLADATLEVLRLVTKVNGTRDSGHCVPRIAIDGLYGSDGAVLEGWPSNAPLPSREALITMLWMIQYFERQIHRRSQMKRSVETGSPFTLTPPQTSAHIPSSQIFQSRVFKKALRSTKHGKQFGAFSG